MLRISFMRDRIVLALIVLSSVLSGCQGAVPSGQSDNAGKLSMASGDAVECENASVSYWGLEDPNQSQTWASDTLRLGYGLPANSSIFFVAYENDTIIGVTHISTDESVAADGDTFTLNTQLSGEHTVTVKMYTDTNGNDTYDSDTDAVCHQNGDVIQTRTVSLNFSEFNTSVEESITDRRFN